MDIYCLQVSIEECLCMDIRAWISLWISTLVWIIEDTSKNYGYLYWYPRIFGNPFIDMLWILGPGKVSYYLKQLFTVSSWSIFCLQPSNVTVNCSKNPVWSGSDYVPSENSKNQEILVKNLSESASTVGLKPPSAPAADHANLAVIVRAKVWGDLWTARPHRSAKDRAGGRAGGTVWHQLLCPIRPPSPPSQCRTRSRRKRKCTTSLTELPTLARVDNESED